jgi:hypothetical protein
MSEQIKAQCPKGCHFGELFLRWNGREWLFTGFVGDGLDGKNNGLRIEATHCICGSKLEKPLPPVTGLSKDEIEALSGIVDFFAHDNRRNTFTLYRHGGTLDLLRSILSRIQEEK